MFEITTPFVVGAVFAMFCSWMLLHALRSYKKALASEHWPSTEGEIDSIELWGKRNVDGRMKEVEKLSLEYAYEVRGKRYKGTTPAFYTLVYPETVNFANSHPKHSAVAVHYDTNDPADSVVIPGPKPGNKRYSDIILACAGLGVAVGISISAALGIIG